MERHSHLNHPTIDAIITVYRDVHLSRHYVQLTNTVVICPAAYENTRLNSVLSRRLVKTPTTSLAVTCSTCHNCDTSPIGNQLCDMTFVVQPSSETVTFANRPSSSTQHERRSDIIDSTLRRIKSPLSTTPTAFDRQAPYTGTSPRDYRYATECHRSVACPSVPPHHTATSLDRCLLPKRRRNTPCGASDARPAPTARISAQRRARGSVQFINGLHQLSND